MGAGALGWFAATRPGIHPDGDQAVVRVGCSRANRPQPWWWWALLARGDEGWVVSEFVRAD